ncbi:MAG: enoyl-CoA hydratase/isomerase family protein [Chrysiogenetes bacterium]|nr:enoyl-CoA hydratase/isomerase family protein [Chrysiogenetes bacterium]
MEQVKLEIDEKVAVITLARPEKRNALSPTMLSELGSVLVEIGKPRNEVRCVLLKAEGEAFCAGGDFGDLSLNKKWKSGELLLRNEYNPLFASLKRLKVPLITAVQGGAVGIGLSLAITGDLILASKQAYFHLMFAKLGLVVEGGASYILPRLIGRSRAFEMSYLMEKVDAQRALEWGLINRLYENAEALHEGALEIAKQIAGSADSLALIREAYMGSYDNSFEQQLELEARLGGQTSETADFKERIARMASKFK